MSSVHCPVAKPIRPTLAPSHGVNRVCVRLAWKLALKKSVRSPNRAVGLVVAPKMGNPCEILAETWLIALRSAPSKRSESA